MHRRDPIFIAATVFAVAAQAQQYAEWSPPTNEIACESIAVAPELDDLLRRREIQSTTAIRVNVDLEGRFSAPVMIERSGTARENIVLDRLALANAVKCKLASTESSNVGRTRRVEYQWNFRLSAPLQVK